MSPTHNVEKKFRFILFSWRFLRATHSSFTLGTRKQIIFWLTLTGHIFSLTCKWISSSYKTTCQIKMLRPSHSLKKFLLQLRVEFFSHNPGKNAKPQETLQGLRNLGIMTYLKWIEIPKMCFCGIYFCKFMIIKILILQILFLQTLCRNKDFQN